jgi:xylulokinase
MRTGAPLMNGVLYGVDTRAAAEIDDLTARIGADTILDRCGNALTSQSVGPKILWMKRNRPEVFAARPPS